ncbi:unnamed protein product [Prorocentrum cordatum]|uniref:FHA domain-containing protein n=1 Tax=Prorocentrum cordatum TaxID=2364126 RepID=A0ABN9U151_9DINO|nr:unnamed protein product [Polarella glacialis]
MASRDINAAIGAGGAAHDFDAAQFQLPSHQCINFGWRKAAGVNNSRGMAVMVSRRLRSQLQRIACPPAQRGIAGRAAMAVVAAGAMSAATFPIYLPPRGFAVAAHRSTARNVLEWAQQELDQLGHNCLPIAMCDYNCAFGIRADVAGRRFIGETGAAGIAEPAPEKSTRQIARNIWEGNHPAMALCMCIFRRRYVNEHDRKCVPERFSRRCDDLLALIRLTGALDIHAPLKDHDESPALFFGPQGHSEQVLIGKSLAELGASTCASLRAVWQGHPVCGGRAAVHWAGLHDASGAAHAAESEGLWAAQEAIGDSILLRLPASWVERRPQGRSSAIVRPGSHWHQFAALFGEVAEVALVWGSAADPSSVELLAEFRERESARGMYVTLARRFLHNPLSGGKDAVCPVVCRSGMAWRLRALAGMPSAADVLRGVWLGDAAVSGALAGEAPARAAGAPARPAESASAAQAADDDDEGPVYQLLRLGGKRPSSVALSRQKPSATLGRSRECDLVVASHLLSREHALLSLLGSGELFVEDRSTNGTWMNGKKLAPRLLTQLQDGDVLRFNEPKGDGDLQDPAFEVRLLQGADGALTPRPPATPRPRTAAAGAAAEGAAAAAARPAAERSAGVPTGGGTTAAAPSAGSAPSGGGERAARDRRDGAGAMAAAAADERARQEDPAERRQRLALAEHNRRQELLGTVQGAYRALNQPLEVGMNSWSEQRLREAHDRLMHRSRGGGQDVERAGGDATKAAAASGAPGRGRVPVCPPAKRAAPPALLQTAIADICSTMVSQDTGTFWSKTLASPRLRCLRVGTRFAGEDFVLQLDSHYRMAEGWDEELVSQLRLCASPKPILTTYPSSYTLPEDYCPGGPDRARLNPQTHPIVMCAREFGEADGFLRSGGKAVFAERLGATPPASLFWAAGFAFCSSAVLEEVPYDPGLEDLFFGEEPCMAARLWTSGWDFFAPTRVLGYHLWTRSHRPVFREHAGEERRRREASSQARARRLLAEAVADSADRYGLGSRRSASPGPPAAAGAPRRRGRHALGVVHEPARQGARREADDGCRAHPWADARPGGPDPRRAARRRPRGGPRRPAAARAGRQRRAAFAAAPRAAASPVGGPLLAPGRPAAPGGGARPQHPGFRRGGRVPPVHRCYERLALRGDCCPRAPEAAWKAAAAVAPAVARAGAAGVPLRPAGLGGGDRTWSSTVVRGDEMAWLSTPQGDSVLRQAARRVFGGLLREESEHADCSPEQVPEGRAPELPEEGPSCGDLGVLLSQLVGLRQELDEVYGLASTRMSLMLARYPGTGAYYTRHLDAQPGRDGPQRRLTALYYLNPSWSPEHGGRLRAYLPEAVGAEVEGARCLGDGEWALDIDPLSDRLVLFSSQWLPARCCPCTPSGSP